MAVRYEGRFWMRVALTLTVAAMTFLSLPALAQNGLPPPPAGFKALEQSSSQRAMKQAGVADSVRAEKPNAGWPGCIVDPKIEFSYGWTQRPGAGQLVDMMAQRPEEPASVVGGIRTEPAGKQRYKDGILIWKKTTTLAAGSSSAKCPDNQVVTYDATWLAPAGQKLLTIGVIRVYGSKTAAQAWIDEYIPKLISAAGAP
jgi:hypothetical protein